MSAASSIGLYTWRAALIPSVLWIVAGLADLIAGAFEPLRMVIFGLPSVIISSVFFIILVNYGSFFQHPELEGPTGVRKGLKTGTENRVAPGVQKISDDRMGFFGLVCR